MIQRATPILSTGPASLTCETTNAFVIVPQTRLLRYIAQMCSHGSTDCVRPMATAQASSFCCGNFVEKAELGKSVTAQLQVLEQLKKGVLHGREHL